MKLLDIMTAKLYNFKNFTIRSPLWKTNFSNNAPNVKKNSLLIGEGKSIALLYVGKKLLLRDSQRDGEKGNCKQNFAPNATLPSPQLIVGKSIVLKNVYRIIGTIKDRQLNFLKENALAVKNLSRLSNIGGLVKNIALINVKIKVVIREASLFNLKQTLNGERKINGKELGGMPCKETSSLVSSAIFNIIHLSGEENQNLKFIM